MLRTEGTCPPRAASGPTSRRRATAPVSVLHELTGAEVRRPVNRVRHAPRVSRSRRRHSERGGAVKHVVGAIRGVGPTWWLGRPSTVFHIGGVNDDLAAAEDARPRFVMGRILTWLTCRHAVRGEALGATCNPSEEALKTLAVLRRRCRCIPLRPLTSSSFCTARQPGHGGAIGGRLRFGCGGAVPAGLAASTGHVLGSDAAIVSVVDLSPRGKGGGGLAEGAVRADGDHRGRFRERDLGGHLCDWPRPVPLLRTGLGCQQGRAVRRPRIRVVDRKQATPRS